MPLSPFMGISVILHLLIIMSFSALNRLAPNRRRNQLRKQGSWSCFWASSLIIVFIFSVVLLGAYALVRASVTNEHSSIKIAETYYEVVFSQHNIDALVVETEGVLGHLTNSF